jgi:flavin reductase (DIM6/NTAB) family NADH-FMN oxidoreductase RutF
MAFSPDDFRQTMRLHPAAVTVIATGAAPNRTGLTATAVMSLSAEATSIVCAVNRSAYSYAKIVENRTFSVNTLAHRQIHLAKAFSGQTGQGGEERFSANEWVTLETGAPVLQGALVSLDCELLQVVESGSHALIIGKVVAAMRTPEWAPLIYVDGTWATVDAGLQVV